MPSLAQVKRFLVGKPIHTKHAHRERLTKRLALPVFASDALSSVAYASEEIMLVLKAASVGLLVYTTNISIAIVALIFIVVISYYQTIHAYPKGGGSYIVAKSNLGVFPGMVAGASVLIDYVLTVAVSVSAGVLAIVSMAPMTQPYLVPMGVSAVGFLTIANLRGARESGTMFAIPTYTFVALLFSMIVVGIFLRPGTPVPPDILEAKPGEFDWVLIFLVLRAFSSGCTALTGIEAIADGVQAFREPTARNASATLVAMALILGSLFLGISVLAEKFHLRPMEIDVEGFMTVVAQISAHVFGKGVFFYTLQIFTAVILILAANTAYADFPRLSSIISRDGFLPRSFGSIGDRLVFQNGIITLAVLATLLIVVFQGNTHRLIPLYAIGVFLSFTLSQAGMAVHSFRAKKSLIVIGISIFGACVTAVVTLVILVTKFTLGAYLVPFALGGVIAIFVLTKRHYNYLNDELGIEPTDSLPEIKTTALLLVPRLHKGILQAIAYARSLSTDVRALHVAIDPSGIEAVKDEWNKFGADIPLVILESPYRSLVEPITDYVDQTIAENPDMMVTVIVPQAIPRRFWHSLLHSNAAVPLKLALGSRPNVVVTNVRYFLR